MSYAHVRLSLVLSDSVVFLCSFYTIAASVVYTALVFSKCNAPFLHDVRSEVHMGLSSSSTLAAVYVAQTTTRPRHSVR